MIGLSDELLAEQTACMQRAFDALLKATAGVGVEIVASLRDDLLPCVNGDFYRGANLIEAQVSPGAWTWPAFEKQIGNGLRERRQVELRVLAKMPAEIVLSLGKISDLRAYANGRAKGKTKDALIEQMKAVVPADEFTAMATQVRSDVIAALPDLERLLFREQALCFLRRVFSEGMALMHLAARRRTARVLPGLKLRLVAGGDVSTKPCAGLHGERFAWDAAAVSRFAPCDRLECSCCWVSDVSDSPYGFKRTLP